MKLVALIDDSAVIEKILRHLDLWPQEAIPARSPPKPIIEGTVRDKPESKFLSVSYLLDCLLPLPITYYAPLCVFSSSSAFNDTGAAHFGKHLTNHVYTDFRACLT